MRFPGLLGSLGSGASTRAHRRWIGASLDWHAAVRAGDEAASASGRRCSSRTSSRRSSNGVEGRTWKREAAQGVNFPLTGALQWACERGV
jgi:hypothetical protein